MPIPLPNLDDRTYADLTAEAQALLPHLYGAWTNHNPSDPGIMLVELLASITEMLLYEANQVSPANVDKFLALLNGPIPAWTRPPDMSLDEALRQILEFGRDQHQVPKWTGGQVPWVRPPAMTQGEAIGRTLRDLREPYRAVTPSDYESLALHAWPQHETARALARRMASGGDAWQVRRVRCVPQRNLAAEAPEDRRKAAPADISLVVVPAPGANDGVPAPSPALCTALEAFFAPRLLLTTRLHVTGPGYVPVTVAARLALHPDAPPGQALAAARQALLDFCHPLTGGPDGQGWPFGRALYRSEIYALLEQVALVDHIEAVAVGVAGAADDPARLLQAGQEVAGVLLDAHELVQLDPAAIDLVAYDVYGYEYR